LTKKLLKTKLFDMKLIAILGQTSCGKSDLAVRLAHKIPNSCIVSCDSRQVYKGLDAGTGKVEGQWQGDKYFFEGVEHFFVDFVRPAQSYGIIDYIQDFTKLIPKIRRIYQTVILTGGTGFWAKSILEKADLGVIKSECIYDFEEYKIGLSNKNKFELQQITKKTNLNESDFQNPRRLVSYLVRKKAINENWLEKIDYPEFESTKVFAIKIEQEDLKLKIANRLESRLKQGIILETQAILPLGKDRIWQLGLEYRLTWCYLHGLMTLIEFEEKLVRENLQYAKRQLTWLKKQQNIIWKTSTEIEKLYSNPNQL
jgi:tRNA dimethylallyltransferase